MVFTKIVKLDQFCKSIMAVDRNVCSVSVIDNNGKLLHSVSHRGLMQPNLEKWNDSHYMECVFDISMGGKFDELYGPIRYHHSNDENFMMFSFPYNKSVIIVTSTKKISPIAFATKISNKIIDSVEQ
ncbi:MAG: hypothetical protein KGI28_08985 [Thaumarchaeota archaeon]|nr:hypothetical protein [Nitrososphaerota archaeon]